MELTPEIQGRLEKLMQKYDAIGQDWLSYLDGLIYANQLTYWDYIHLDTLLSLQTPRTNFPDEPIFIMYHQVTELYFKLILHEMDQLAAVRAPSRNELMMRMERMIRYSQILTNSFDVMVDGMEPQQFLKFRMSLLPASGFQSVQYRLIEFRSTDLYNMVHPGKREGFSVGDVNPALYEDLYWKHGNLELKTGKKTLTLQMFEAKYDKRMFEEALQCRETNLNAIFRNLPPEVKQDPEVRDVFRAYDLQMNVFWSLSHYRSAVKYLSRETEDIKATGGTNWQKFLPPRFQKIQFFPELWTQTETEEWGKDWVVQLFKDQVENSWRRNLKA